MLHKILSIRAHIQFPFELNEQVYLSQPPFRNILGPFTITGLLRHDTYQLSDITSRVVYGQVVEGKDLIRDPSAVRSGRQQHGG